MPFFLPRSLIRLEYLSGENSEEEKEIAKPYEKEIEFAFFAVNLGYSKQEYEALTPREIRFIYKAWENKIVSDSYYMYHAMFTAFYNVNRPKRKRALKLWEKAKTRKADMEIVKRNLKLVREVEKKEGKSWVEQIYKFNHIRRERGEEDGRKEFNL